MSGSGSIASVIEHFLKGDASDLTLNDLFRKGPECDYFFDERDHPEEIEYLQALKSALYEWPVSPDVAVELIRQCPRLVPILKYAEFFRNLFNNGQGLPLTSLGILKVREVLALLDRTTREQADLSRLLEQGDTDREKFECLTFLASLDLLIPGAPNFYLRHWAAARPFMAPPKWQHRGPRRMEFRDAIITLVMGYAYLLGFPAYHNTKKKPNSQAGPSAGDITREVLSDFDLPDVGGLEKIWTANRKRFAHWPLSE